MKSKLKLIVVVSFMLIVSYLSGQVPVNGLIGYWPFNSNSNDESGNGYNATADGPVLTIDRSGNASSAYKFAGGNDKITVADTAVLDNIGNSVSISAWIKPTGTWDQSYRAAIVGKGGWDLNSGYEFSVLGDMMVEVNIVRTTIYDQDYRLPLNAYTHLIAVFDDTKDSAYIYVNGELLVSGEVTQSINESTTPLYIGRRCDGNQYVASFKGDIDEVCVYNRVLSVEEIDDLYRYQQKICYQTVTVTDTLIINLTLVDLNPVTYENTIKVYPNPARDNLIIDCGDNYDKLSGYSIKITNNLGQVVYESEITQRTETIIMNEWSGKGLYLFYIMDGAKTIDVKKIILQ